MEYLAVELGFEGATGEETVIPAGEGYFVLWREDLPTLYVYSPDDGWHAVNGSGIDEEWAETQLMIQYESQGIDGKLVYEEIEKYGNAGNAYIRTISPDLAIKGNGFIAFDPFVVDYSVSKLSYVYSGVVIDLNDYMAYSLKKDELTAYVANDGGLYTFSSYSDNYGVLNHIDAKGNVIELYDFSKTGAAHVSSFYVKSDGWVVVYSKEDGTYVSWIDKDGNIEKTNFVCGGKVVPMVWYYDDGDTVLINKGDGYKTYGSICVISKYDGDTRAVFYDSKIQSI